MTMFVKLIPTFGASNCPLYASNLQIKNQIRPPKQSADQYNCSY